MLSLFSLLILRFGILYLKFVSILFLNIILLIILYFHFYIFQHLFSSVCGFGVLGFMPIKQISGHPCFEYDDEQELKFDIFGF